MMVLETLKLAGALPSPPDPKDHQFAFQRSPLFLGSASLEPKSVDLTDAHWWRVQGAGSCVSYATAEQAQDLANVQGNPLPLLSGAGLYARARILGAPPIPGEGIPDGGSNCRLNLKVVRDYGYVTEDEYPDVPSNIFRVPPASVFAAPPVAQIDTFRRIHGEGDVTTLRAGLQAAMTLAGEGRCSVPSAVMPVDDAYGGLPIGDVYMAQGNVRWNGVDLPERPYHCQAIIVLDVDRDAVGFASTWGGNRIYYVSIPLLAEIGAEFWLFENLIRPSRLA